MLSDSNFSHIYLYSTKIAIEAQHGLIAQVIKDIVFSMRPQQNAVAEAADTAMQIED